MNEADKKRQRAWNRIFTASSILEEAVEQLEGMLSEETEGSEDWTEDFVENTNQLISDIKTLREHSKFL